ncbi:MAG: 50S ribosomal protein L4 [Phycisphaerae bacterium]|jgi:large subunit ribosomal protein L4|nr:MAG: 50S ribosomal protein L4 [Phycisphaerae bacterium]
MIEVPVFNIEGAQVGTVSIDEQKLGGEVNAPLLKQALVYYHANKRQGTVRTLARGEVEGSTRKLYRQKGTGNARTGGIRNPIKVGGGHAKQKRPKDWSLDLPKKARRLARNNALLAKIKDNQLKVVDQFTLSEPKTKLFAGVLKKLGIDRTVLFALESKTEPIVRASRNIPTTRLTTVAQLNAWDILRNRTVLITKSGLEALLA